jgi:hypothetical protein
VVPPCGIMKARASVWLYAQPVSAQSITRTVTVCEAVQGNESPPTAVPLKRLADGGCNAQLVPTALSTDALHCSVLTDLLAAVLVGLQDFAFLPGCEKQAWTLWDPVMPGG